MKFTDGYWLLREGVTAACPAEVLDVTESDNALEIHAPTRPIRSRGDLLTGPVLTLRAHAPMPDVIGLTLTHGDTLRASCGAPAAPWALATAGREALASTGTGSLRLEAP